ncbi:MAG: hypothetical protein R2781_12100 [Flavobacteriaceae bacterium]
MMYKKNILEQIDEAIASKETSESNRELLIEIKQKFENAKSKEEIVAIVMKLLELFGIFANAVGSG